MTIAIDDIKSAIHAVSGFFRALGTDIVAGLNWLQHNVYELIQAAETNAKVIESLLGQLPAAASAQLTAYETWPTATSPASRPRRTKPFRTWPPTWKRSRSAPQRRSPATTHTGSNDADTVVGDIATVLSHVSHNWLLDKIMSWFGGDSDLAVNPAVSTAIKDLITVVVDAADMVEDMTNRALDRVQGPLCRPRRLQGGDLRAAVRRVRQASSTTCSPSPTRSPT